MASNKNRPLSVKECRREIPRMIQTIRDRDYYSVLRDFFELSAISVRNYVDLGAMHDEYERRYVNIAKQYSKEQLEIFATCLGLFMGEINAAINGSGEFRDFAGEIYMDSGTCNGKAGQFFTPYSVSQCMARINLPKDEVRAKLGDDPDHVLTIYEPTCGAGGLVVASIDALKEAGVNYSWNVFVDCGDIDPRCVHMTYLTLSLLGVPAVVRLGDALMMDYREAWFTPAYILAWPHFKSRIGKGKYPVKATVPKEEEEKEIVKAAEAAIAEKTVTPKPCYSMDADGQLSLF